jgi:hypothetical protein
MRLVLSGELQSGRQYIQLPVAETEREVCPKAFPQAAAYSIFVCAYIHTRGWQWLELLYNTYRIQTGVCNRQLSGRFKISLCLTGYTVPVKTQPVFAI